MSPKTRDLEVVRRFQSEVASVREAREPVAIRMTVHILAATVLLAIIIMSVVKVDRIITSETGKIIPTIRPSIFQAYDTSIIKSIDVKEGDFVAKGQVMVTLDPTFTSADVAQLVDQIAALNAQIARARAEQEGHAPVYSYPTGPADQQYIALQNKLYEQRSAQYKAQIDSFDQKIKQTTATILKGQNDEARYTQRDHIAGQVDVMHSTLLEKGAGTLLAKLQAEDAHLEMLRELENTHNSIIENQHLLASLQADREAFIQSWASSLGQETVTAQTTRDTDMSNLEKAQKHHDLVKIVAMEDSYVLSVAKLTEGSVLQAGYQYITTIPAASPLEAEVTVSSRDIGFIRVGDSTTLKVDAFEYSEYGTAEGEVKWIGEGALFFNQDTNQAVQPYYLVRISIGRLKFVHVPATFRLVPGMTLTADINVGTRTLMSYLLQAVVRGGSTAMREP